MYHDLIKTHVESDIDPRHVEAYMRLECSTLDRLSEFDFAWLAQSTGPVIRADRDAAERLAKSYAL